MGAGGIINAIKFWPHNYSKILTAAVDGTITLNDIEGKNTQVLADTLNAHEWVWFIKWFDISQLSGVQLLFLNVKGESYRNTLSFHWIVGIPELFLCNLTIPFPFRRGYMKVHNFVNKYLVEWNPACLTIVFENFSLWLKKGSGGNIQAMKFWPLDDSKVVSAGLDGTVTLHDLNGKLSTVLADTMNFYE